MLATPPLISGARTLHRSLTRPVSGLACSQKNRKLAFSRSSRNWWSSGERGIAPGESADWAGWNAPEAPPARICRNSLRRDSPSDLFPSSRTLINIKRSSIWPFAEAAPPPCIINSGRGAQDVEHKAPARRRLAIWIALGVGLGIAMAVLLVELPRFGRERSLAGAVLIADADPRKQLPVPNVEITAEAA